MGNQKQRDRISAVMTLLTWQKGGALMKCVELLCVGKYRQRNCGYEV